MRTVPELAGAVVAPAAARSVAEKRTRRRQPGDTATASFRSRTSTGTEMANFLPLPSWPDEPSPQQLIRVVASTAHDVAPDSETVRVRDLFHFDRYAVRSIGLVRVAELTDAVGAPAHDVSHCSARHTTWGRRSRG